MEINNKTRFFYVLYSDKTWAFDQSDRAQDRIYIIIMHKVECFEAHLRYSELISSKRTITIFKT